MHDPISRRDFLRSAAWCTAASAAWPVVGGPRRAYGQTAPSGGDGWSFALLGDTHYDLMAHHDMDWVQREKPNDIRQIEGYVKVTEEYLPRLASELRTQIAEAPRSVDYVVHMGDFTEGLCGSYELQRKQFEDALAWVESGQWSAPFLMTKGNHDITGPGAREAYRDTMLPFLSGQIDRKLDSASFAVEHKNALLVFFDAYEPDQSLAWLRGVLEKRSAQHVFFVIHTPVIPYHARANWTVYGRPDETTQRRELINLLGRHRAIILSGHLHRYGFVKRTTDDGYVIEVALCSVIRSAEGRGSVDLEGPQSYGPDIVELEPNFSPGTRDLRREIFRAEAPFIEHFECGSADGYAMVHIDGDRVSMDIYAGLGRRHWRTLDISALIEAAEV